MCVCMYILSYLNSCRLLHFRNERGEGRGDVHYTPTERFYYSPVADVSPQIFSSSNVTCNCVGRNFKTSIPHATCFLDTSQAFNCSIALPLQQTRPIIQSYSPRVVPAVKPRDHIQSKESPRRWPPSLNT